MMKITTVGLTALLGAFGNLLAIERPSGEKQAEKIPTRPAAPQGGVLRKDQRQAGPDARLRAANAAYLGVGGEPLSEELALHLNLEGGLVLKMIDPTSPAALAGLEVNDIVMAVGGKKLTDQESLRASLSEAKVGDEIEVKLIRRGKATDRKVILGEAPARPNLQLNGRPANGNANENGNREIERMLEKRLGQGLGGLGNELQAELMERLEQAFGDREGGFKRLRLELGEGRLKNEGFNMGLRGVGSMRLEDAEGSIEMNMEDGQRELVIRDKNGVLLFEGPYDTDVDKAAVPEEYRERVKGLTGGTKGAFQLKFDRKELFRNRQKELEKKDE